MKNFIFILHTDKRVSGCFTLIAHSCEHWIFIGNTDLDKMKSVAAKADWHNQVVSNTSFVWSENQCLMKVNMREELDFFLSDSSLISSAP